MLNKIIRLNPYIFNDFCRHFMTKLSLLSMSVYYQISEIFVEPCEASLLILLGKKLNTDRPALFGCGDLLKLIKEILIDLLYF
jgi:hypothetical protein